MAGSISIRHATAFPVSSSSRESCVTAALGSVLRARSCPAGASGERGRKAWALWQVSVQPRVGREVVLCCLSLLFPRGEDSAFPLPSRPSAGLVGSATLERAPAHPGGEAGSPGICLSLYYPGGRQFFAATSFRFKSLDDIVIFMEPSLCVRNCFRWIGLDCE